MQILVIGYGKIGRVKADIWRTLGCEVYIHDVSASAMSQANERGLKQYSEGVLKTANYILDISTPAGQHLNSLVWALEHGASNPRAILIEKPLASTREEIDAFFEFIERGQGQQFADKTFIDESYFSSDSIKSLAETLRKHSEEIISVEIELSKKRLPDSISGRFFDEHLGVLGIEAPHMLAILEMLGLDVTQLSVNRVDLLVGQSMLQNQALLLDGSCGEAAVSLISYLGDFRLVSNKLVTNEGISRHVKIVTNKQKYLLALDPVANLPRLKAQLDVLIAEGIHSRTIISDDHLRAHLRQFITDNELTSIGSPFGIQHALVVSDILIGLRGQCRVVPIENKESLEAVLNAKMPDMKGVH